VSCTELSLAVSCTSWTCGSTCGHWREEPDTVPSSIMQSSSVRHSMYCVLFYYLCEVLWAAVWYVGSNNMGHVLYLSIKHCIRQRHVYTSYCAYQRYNCTALQFHVLSRVCVVLCTHISLTSFDIAVWCTVQHCVLYAVPSRARSVPISIITVPISVMYCITSVMFWA
jgi:hypothetical protein